MAADGDGEATAPRLIKKYANRRLYDTGTSAYVTLDHLADLVRAGTDFRVVDAKTGEDLTHSVLSQIIMEEGRGAAMLPVNVLKQLISLYGGGGGGAVAPYLEAAMDAYAKNGAAWRQAMANPFDPAGWSEIARAQMSMMGGAWARPAPGKEEGEDVEELKRRLDALQAEVDRLRK